MLDSRLRGNDKKEVNSTYYRFVEIDKKMVL